MISIMNKLHQLEKALIIAAEDFWKYEITRKGFEKYILENNKEGWIQKHVSLWLKKAVDKK